MKRGFRLTRSAEIKKLRRNGKKIAHQYFLLVSQPNEQKGVRVAITAGRSIGGAVQRNRAKRVLRAAIQPLIALIKPDLDIILVAKPAIQLVKSNDLQLVISDQLKRSKLLQ